MPKTVFRPCKRKDLHQVQNLVHQLYEDDPGEYPTQPDIQATFLELEQRPEKGQIIVFEQGTTIVGYAILIFFWSNEFGGDILEIDELLVDRQFQRRGIGKEFLKWLENSDRKYAGYALQVSPHNDRALALYESVGFRPSRSHYLIKIP